jgi:diguanylate cyclase (GGDEF)-like protein
MDRVELPPESAVRCRSRVDRDRAVEIVRDGTETARIVGDPSNFIASMERELQRMRRHSDSSSLLMIGPDGRIDIKAMDRMGARFAANLRSYDSLCRYGGNHFLVLLPHVVSLNVPAIARRLRIQVAGYAVKFADGNDGFVTATIGGVMLDSEIPMHENIDRAVLAYKEGKERGGDAENIYELGRIPEQRAIAN